MFGQDSVKKGRSSLVREYFSFEFWQSGARLSQAV